MLAESETSADVTGTSEEGEHRAHVVLRVPEPGYFGRVVGGGLDAQQVLLLPKKSREACGAGCPCCATG
eukprot:6205104-Pleurochrysis_carterae.AAC.2